jgi:hypothetical protein
VLIPLGLYGYGAVREWRAERRLARAIELADADDPGWRLESLRAEYDRQPTNQLLLFALNEFSKTPPYRGWYGDDITTRPGALSYGVAVLPNARMPSEYFTILRERLNAPTVVPLRQAVNRFFAGPIGRVPHLFQELERGRLSDRMYYLSNYNSDELLLAVHEGRSDDALERIQRHLTLSLPLHDAPGLMPRLLSRRALSSAANDTQTVLAHTILSSTQLERLQKQLTAYPALDMVSHLRVIRAEAEHELHRLRTDPSYRDAYHRRTYVAMIPANATWFDKLKARLGAWLGPWMEGSLTEYHAEAIECLNDAIALARDHPNHPFTNEPWVLQWDKAKNPLATYSRMVFAQETTKLLLEGAISAVACERFRMAKGHWPDSLRELVPGYLPRVPTDPYTGQPVLYRKLEDGIVIYSAWRNRSDDGGNVLDGGPPNRDRGIRLYNPDKRGLKYEEVYKRPEE